MAVLKILIVIAGFTIMVLVAKLLIRLFAWQKTSNATKMVKCLKCQLYIPKDKAYFLAGKPFCSKDHATDYNHQ